TRGLCPQRITACRPRRGAVKPRGSLGPIQRRDTCFAVPTWPERRSLADMSLFDAAILGTYFLTLVILSVFGLHRYIMLYLYYRYRDRRALPAPLPETLGKVTVQLPIFNEMYVVDRLLASVTQIRYPKELLEIQILDDSTDETVNMVAAAVERYRAEGFDMVHVHRQNRYAYTPGARAEGLKVAKGEFILIFDADFVAPPDILEKLMGHFGDPQV